MKKTILPFLLSFVSLWLNATCPMTDDDHGQKLDANGVPYEMVVDKVASFPGGDAAFAEWFDIHVTYPKACRKARVQGRVIVGFIVELDGRLSNFRIARNLTGPEATDEQRRLFEKAALKAVKSKRMPKWKPAYKKTSEGYVPVRMLFNVPLTFRP